MSDLLDLLGAWGVCNEDSRWVCGEPLGYHGYNYQTVEIGGQCWFAENLRTETTLQGTQMGEAAYNCLLAEDHEEHAYCIPLYSDWPSAYVEGLFVDFDIETHGQLYNPAAANADICPFGWRVASINDFEQLTDFAISQNVDEGMVGQALTSTTFSGTDLFGFAALPSGGIEMGFEFTGFSAWTHIEPGEIAFFQTPTNGLYGIGRVGLLPEGPVVDGIDFALGTYPPSLHQYVGLFDGIFETLGSVRCICESNP